MWNRLGVVDQVYYEEAARYFGLVLLESNQDISVHELMFATDLDLADRIIAKCSTDMKSMVLSRLNFNERIRAFSRRLETRCAGFLEVVPIGEGRMSPTFIHRSVKDFLLDIDEGRKLMLHDKSSREERVISLTKSFLASTVFILGVRASGQESGIASQSFPRMRFEVPGDFLRSVRDLRFTSYLKKTSIPTFIALGMVLPHCMLLSLPVWLLFITP